MKQSNRNKKMTAALAMTAVLISAPMVRADSFGSGANEFTMDFVNIGNAGNANDGASGSTAYGGVSYNYRMGVHEVSERMIDSYNAANSGVLISHHNRGADKPATSVSWNEATRFVNWLNTSQGYQAAYNVSGEANSTIALWSSGNAWQLGGENLFRHKDAHYFLPSEDEWYKTAYYNPDTSTYNDYATGRDTAPTAVANGTAAETAVYAQSYAADPADITNAGGLSSYGTMAQTGNVWEWGESGVTAPNDLASNRVVRGGAWYNDSSFLPSSKRADYSPTYEFNDIGFRVAAVPEPSGVSLLVIGAMGLLMKRRRRTITTILTVGALSSVSATLLAGEAAAPIEIDVAPTIDDDAWRFKITPYVMIPSLSGNIKTSGGGSIALPTGLAESEWDFSLPLALDLGKGRWGVGLEFFYLGYSGKAVRWTPKIGPVAKL